MLKSQDCMLLLKILACEAKGISYPKQNEMAVCLCYSQSEVNAGYQRLKQANLIRESFEAPNLLRLKYTSVTESVMEFLVFGLKYFFPASLGEYTRGIPTSIGAPVFKDKIALGNMPIPIWPYAEGQVNGLALEPLYHSIPKSLMKYPDSYFYDLLAIVDTLRLGQARERGLAANMLTYRLSRKEK